MTDMGLCDYRGRTSVLSLVVAPLCFCELILWSLSTGYAVLQTLLRSSSVNPLSWDKLYPWICFPTPHTVNWYSSSLDQARILQAAKAQVSGTSSGLACCCVGDHGCITRETSLCIPSKSLAGFLWGGLNYSLSYFFGITHICLALNAPNFLDFLQSRRRG